MKAHWFQFFTGEWKKDPELGKCSPSTRGIWIDLICAMHEDDRRGMVCGTVRELARLARCDSEEMSSAVDELDRHQAAEIVKGPNGIVTVINRRMFDEYNERKATQLRQQKHRDRSSYKACHADVTPNVTPPSPQNNAVKSELDILSRARTRVMGELQQRGVLTPDAVSVGEVAQKVEAYSTAADRPPEDVAVEAFKAMDRLAESWPVRRVTPALFCKHWDAIQQVMAGSDPRPRNPRAPPEPSQRKYEDAGEVARRMREGT